MKEAFLQNRLEERARQQALRSLQLAGGKVDFCSNDYLGIVHDRLLEKHPAIGEELAGGSTGSRLLAGHSRLMDETESLLAAFHQAEAALLFNSGYDANLGLLSCVPQRGDTILYDYLSHASLRDGIRLSFAQAHAFAHNDLNELEDRLRRAKGRVFVVTESVFSMDGDVCPLNDLAALCQTWGAHLIVDEAHATGVMGPRGAGLVQQTGLADQVFARVHTFGKACGAHGAAVLGSRTLRDYLINFARPLIYTTALPPHSVARVRASYQLFPGLEAERERLGRLIRQFTAGAAGPHLLASGTPIQAVVIPGNSQVREVARALQQNNLDVRPVLYPTVPRGLERLRVVLHSFNTEAEVELLLNTLKNSV
ncbi:MAG TPA: 8-amino-7-oxononanoate synthase [Chitinophagaceae bacterium]|nr:8-amino-7-oxononanoate synthase [Chitinophagaceae bacterium]